MDPISFILAAVVGGLVVGALARLIIPGRDPLSILQTILVGVAGSLVAGLITTYVFGRERFPGLILSVICAAVLVFAIRKFRERQLGGSAPATRASGFGGGSPLGGGMGGGGVQFRFMPGCLIFSLLASVVLTVLLNLILRAL